MTKRLKDLAAGDVVKMEDGGSARIIDVRPATWIRTTNGPAVDIRWKVISGPQKGYVGWYVGAASEEVNLLRQAREETK